MGIDDLAGNKSKVSDMLIVSVICLEHIGFLKRP
jgi:hypothetical protein